MFKLPGSVRGRRDGGFRIPAGKTSRRAGGGLGCGTMAVIGIVLYFLGVNPMTILGQLGGGLGQGLDTAVNQSNPRPKIERTSKQKRSDDEEKEFVSTILGSTEEIWTGVFKAYGKRYPKPDLVLFSDSVKSACGFASSASGPFYCPGDKKVYIDLTFYKQLASKFGAKGDFAQAYVLAHEVGQSCSKHHRCAARNLTANADVWTSLKPTGCRCRLNCRLIVLLACGDITYSARDGWIVVICKRRWWRQPRLVMMQSKNERKGMWFPKASIMAHQNNGWSGFHADLRTGAWNHAIHLTDGELRVIRQENFP